MQRYVNPTPFDIRPGIELLFMALVGGAGQIAGAVVGAAIVVFLKNVLQDVLPAITRYSAQLEVVFFGVLFILLLAEGARRHRADDPPLPAAAGAHRAGRSRAAADARRALQSTDKPVLRIENATKLFGALAAVNEVSFEVRPGEVLGLIGPNGAGKTTLLNLITGTAKPNSGKVLFLGDEVTAMPARQIAAKGMARTFQHVKLRPNMTLIDNVVLGTYPRTHSGFLAGALRLDRAEERSARFEALHQLQRVGLGEKFGELAGNLPLGQQRLLEVARALAANPVLVILDEPAAGLRALEKKTLAELLRALRARRHDHRAGRARHGLRDEPRRPHRGDGFRRQAHRGAAGRHPRRRARAGSLSRRCRMTALLSVKDMHVSYGKIEAVTGVSLDMQAGQIVTVIGPNGAGKTTLLAALMGLLPSTGESRYEQHDLRALSTEERVRQRHLSRAGAPRAVHRDVGRRQPRARRLYALARPPRRGSRPAGRLRALPAPRRTAAPARRHVVGRRAADAGARPRADGASRGSFCSTSRASAWRR